MRVHWGPNRDPNVENFLILLRNLSSIPLASRPIEVSKHDSRDGFISMRSYGWQYSKSSIRSNNSTYSWKSKVLCNPAP